MTRDERQVRQELAEFTRPVLGVDADPLNDRCDACGADAGEPCRPGCISVPEAGENDVHD